MFFDAPTTAPGIVLEIKGPIDPGVDQFDAMFQQTETGIRWKLRGKLAQKLYAKENLSTTSWVALVCVLLAMPVMDILSTVDPSIPRQLKLARKLDCQSKPLQTHSPHAPADETNADSGSAA